MGQNKQNFYKNGWQRRRDLVMWSSCWDRVRKENTNPASRFRFICVLLINRKAVHRQQVFCARRQKAAALLNSSCDHRCPSHPVLMSRRRLRDDVRLETHVLIHTLNKELRAWSKLGPNTTRRKCFHIHDPDVWISGRTFSSFWTRTNWMFVLLQ